MSKKNWNIKEVEEHIRITGNKPTDTFQQTKYNNIGGSESSTLTMLDLRYVCPSVINLLREKLIEDIDSIDCTDKSKLKKWEIIEEVLEVIDKRFGVEKHPKTKE